MRAAVFTPTRLPGIDVSLASIDRQDFEGEILWIVGDEFFKQRRDLYPRSVTYAFDSSLPRGIVPNIERTLCRAYNHAVVYALECEADVFISMQDYIWAPADGVSRFVSAIQRHPDRLITGLTSISQDPEPDAVVDPTNMITIFGKEYTERPKELRWKDSRVDDYPGRRGFVRIPNIEFEANWCAFPMSLFEKGARWPEEYDEGVAYENQALAARAISMGYKCFLDCDNEAISLPHKWYRGLKDARGYDDLETREIPLSNKERHEAAMMKDFGTTVLR